MNNSNNMVDNNEITPQQSNNISNGNMPPISLQNETATNQNVVPTQQQNNYSNQPNNDYISNNLNGMNSTVIGPMSNNNNNMESTIINPVPINQQINLQQSQNYTSNTNFNDDELLKVFIGKNYEKITTKPFNFASFFFTTFYMFYRKMFLYGILLFIVNLIISNFVIKNVFIVSILLGIIVGFLFNKIYLYYAKKKINKIKLENPQKNNEELKAICLTKGGTSIGKIFLGILVQFCIAFVVIIIMIIMGLNSFITDLFNLEN